MKRLFFTSIVLFFQICNTIGQDIAIGFKNQIKFTPSATVNFVYKGLEFSYERKFSRRTSVQMSAMYFVDLFKVYPTGWTDFQGFRLSGEGKYFIKIKKYVHYYLSFGLSYDESSFLTIERFGPQAWLRDSTAEARSYLDSISIETQGSALNCKFGIQVPLKHFIIDLSVGVGAKHWNIWHEDRLNSDDKLGAVFHKRYKYWITEQGKRYTIDIPVSIKMGYIF